jgi:hypothetical protein
MEREKAKQLVAEFTEKLRVAQMNEINPSVRVFFRNIDHLQLAEALEILLKELNDGK